jgi:hypothetical protein
MMECAYKTWQMLNGGNQWSGWVAYLSFFRYIVKLDIDYSKWDHYEKAAIHSGPRYMHSKFCIVSDRPVILEVDKDNQPHSEKGPFCQWSDGAALYAVHGKRIPWPMIECPHEITADMIDAQDDEELKKTMANICPPDQGALWAMRSGKADIGG